MFANARMYVQCMRGNNYRIIERGASDLLIQTKIKKIK